MALGNPGSGNGSDPGASYGVGDDRAVQPVLISTTEQGLLSQVYPSIITGSEDTEGPINPINSPIPGLANISESGE